MQNSPADRENLIDVFLGSVGWRGADRARLAGDASFRRYLRVELDGKSAVLMDAPPPQEDVRPFVTIARHLANLGYSAPEIYEQDPIEGFLLLEDLGDDTFTSVLAAGGDEEALYNSAVDVLIDLHRRNFVAAIPDGIPVYDEDAILEEAALFTDWYLPAVIARPKDAAVRKAYLDIWRKLMPVIEAVPQTLVLRDYHVDNLMWLPDRGGLRACGLLDFQDAVAGPAPYDLMSLLEDARRDVPPFIHRNVLTRYRGAVPHANTEAFDAAYAVLAAQRHCKVVGIFTRLAQRDRKFDYLIHIGRVWRLLESACGHPALAGLAAWLNANIPADRRGVAHMTRRA